MAKVLQHKVVSALPTPLEANSIYFVRVGTGFDIHVTNSSGTIVAYPINREPLIAAGTTDQFYRGDKSWQDLAGAVRAVSLAGLSTANSSAVVAADSLIVGVGKLQAQVNSRLPLSGGKLSGALGREYVAGTSGLQRFQDLAAYTSNASSVTGTIKVKLPFSWTSTMMNVRIAGFNYVNGASWEILVGGYNPSASSSWTRVTASVVAGRPPFSQVRLAHDGANCCILLGDTATAHAYPKVVVKEFLGGYQGMLNDWANGWAVDIITDETGITATQTVTGLTGTSAQYRRGDDTWQDLATAVRSTILTGLTIATGAAIAAGDQLLVALGKLQGQINTLNAGKEDLIGLGTAAQYWRGDKSWRDFFTDVRSATLTGLTLANTAAVVATDTVLVGLGKLQAQVNGKAAAGNNSDITNLNALATATWGSSGRILGDFSNAMVSLRTYLQSSTANSGTIVGALPNGTATSASYACFSASDPTNSSYIQILASNGQARLIVGNVGTGSIPYLAMFINATEWARIANNGTVMFNLSDITGVAGGTVARAGNYFTLGAMVAQCNADANIYLSKASGFSNNNFQAFYVNGTGVGSVTTTGTTTSFNTTSDRRTKFGIVDADADAAWENLDRYRIRSHYFTADPNYLVRYSGIADELQQANPDMVTGEAGAVRGRGIVYEMRPVGQLLDVDGGLVATDIEEPEQYAGSWVFTHLAEIVTGTDMLEPADMLPGVRWEQTHDEMVLQGVDWSKPVAEMILNQQTAKAKIIALEERAAAQDAQIAELKELIAQLSA